MSKFKILFKLTGSIACFKACQLISRLMQEGYQVQIVTTESALEFVGRATLEGLTGRPVLVDMFAKGHPMDHIEFVKWADLTILCPATGNVINKMSQGVADDLVTTLFLAHDFAKPYFVVPAMNTKMYLHPATQTSLKKLSEWGIKVLETQNGKLACGTSGPGRMLEADEIYRQIFSLEIMKKIEAVDDPDLSKFNGVSKNKPVDVLIGGASEIQSIDSLSKQKILITAGGTIEPIDGVRAITNTSSGYTGAVLADSFIKKGFEVVLLHSKSAKIPEGNCRRVEFLTFNDLHQQLKNILANESFAAVIHLAAVSDFHVAEIEVGNELVTAGAFTKIDSDKPMKLHLKKNIKLVQHLRAWAKYPQFKLVAFKLTNDENKQKQFEAVKKIVHSFGVDYVVHNDLHEISEDRRSHMFSLFRGDDEIAHCQGARALAETLEKEIFISQQSSVALRENQL